MVSLGTCLPCAARWAIASLTAALMGLPLPAIAAPETTVVAYYKLRIDAFELYVAPFWFDRPSSDQSGETTEVSGQPAEPEATWPAAGKVPSWQPALDTDATLDTRTQDGSVVNTP